MYYLSKDFLGKVYRYALPLVLCAVAYLNFVIFTVPSESTMGEVYRLLYIHVGAAVALYCTLSISFISAVIYLLNTQKALFYIAYSANSVSLLLSSLVLLTGMIWGNYAWGTPWNWEPRLVSTLILWLFILSSQYYMNYGEDSDKTFRVGSVFMIISAVQIPIVIYSIKFLDSVNQVHPQVAANQGLTDKGYVLAWILSTLIIPVLAIVMTVSRYLSIKQVD